MVLTKRKKKNGIIKKKRNYSKIRKRTRDFDQIYNDFNGNKNIPYNEDLKGGGQFKCFACDIYFISEKAQKEHEKSKKHKRRMKLMQNEKPYTYKDALKAADIIA